MGLFTDHEPVAVVFLNDGPSTRSDSPQEYTFVGFKIVTPW